MRNNEYQTGGNYPCLMIQTNRNRQIRDSNLNRRMGNHNHHTDSLDNLNLRTNNNGDSLNNLSSLLRSTLQRSMLHLLTVPNQFRAICHHSSSGGHDVVSGSC